MRLLSLTLQAVGPFADRHTVDFAALGSSGLFLLEGPQAAREALAGTKMVINNMREPVGGGWWFEPRNAARNPASSSSISQPNE